MGADDVTGAATTAGGPAWSPGSKTERLGLVLLFPASETSEFVTWPLRGTLDLGRQRGSAVQLRDPRVSRSHASIRVHSSKVLVTDLASRHGTFLNGKQLLPRREHVLEYGAIVRCGHTLLLVTDDIDAYAVGTQRLSKGYLGLRHDFLAGPRLFDKWQQATRAASALHPVLITGESGTGKEVIARLVHAGRKSPGPFVALNVAAIPEGLFESELFGYVRGAFTGAVTAKAGAFREAAGGVLFLDEVGDLRQDLQVKLLRALEAGVVRPLGSPTDVPTDVRVVAATSRNLQEAIAKQSFRADLYYRLAGTVVALPPLRERKDEIVALALESLKAHSRALTISVEAIEKLVLHRLPGNVRELQQMLYQAISQADDQSAPELLPAFLPDPVDFPTASGAGELTTESVLEAMSTMGGNASRAAKFLGVSRATLYNFCTRSGVELAGLRRESHVDSTC